MSAIADIEDAVIQAVRDLGIFRSVESAGRKEPPSALSYPSAFVFFKSERGGIDGPRPIADMEFGIIVVNKNLSNEKSAANDMYSLLDSVRDAVEGKRFGITDQTPFRVYACEMADYENGIIAYAIRLGARRFLPVPSE